MPAPETMKSSGFKSIVRCVLCLVTIGVILLIAHFQDLGDQYGVVDYFTFAISNMNPRRPYQHGPIETTAGDKVIVMAKMEHEDTSWVAEELSEYVELDSIARFPSFLTLSSAGSTPFTLSILLRAQPPSSPRVSIKCTNQWPTLPT